MHKQYRTYAGRAQVEPTQSVEQSPFAPTAQTSRNAWRHLTPERRAQAEKTNTLVALQRAARRCAKHLGRGATMTLLEVVRAELGEGGSNVR